MFAALVLVLPQAGLTDTTGGSGARFDPAFVEQTEAPKARPTAVRVATFAEGLEHPWGIAALPDGSFLVTERPGRLRMVSAAGAVSAPLAGVPEVAARGQGGLLDVAVPPDFAATREVWLSYAKPVPGGSVTAVARGVLSVDGAALESVQDVFLQSPVVESDGHFGSRIVFDGEWVFVTLGERQGYAALAQDAGATFGKVVRLGRDGTVPADNPLGGAVWSTGHRNPQGAALDLDGRLWAVEHGPRGGDELNLIEAGANYGWPVVTYGVNYSGRPVGEGIPRAEGLAEPVYFWDPVIAPGGMLFYRGTAFDWRGDALIASLNPGGLVRLEMDGDRVTGEEVMLSDVGRVRDVEELADGTLLVLIDAGDGRILQVQPR
jgi:glucose/arabinose dehydrogenase